ncbi:MAG: hypothetical protein AB1816_00435 [Bacillota bacterium]
MIVFCYYRIGPRAYRGMRWQDWESARRLGHLPANGGRLYFTSDRGLAEYYALLWAERHGDRPVVVSFPTPPIEVVMPDESGVTAGAECVGAWRTEFFTTVAVPLSAVTVEEV